MLPPVVTKSLEDLTSMVVTFVVITVVVAAIAALLARQFGGKSKANRQAIFSIVSFLGLCGAAFYSMSRLSGGG